MSQSAIKLWQATLKEYQADQLKAKDTIDCLEREGHQLNSSREYQDASSQVGLMEFLIANAKANIQSLQEHDAALAMGWDPVLLKLQGPPWPTQPPEENQ